MKKVGIILIVFLVVGCTFLANRDNEHKVLKALPKISGTALVNEYTIYGRFLNFQGEIQGEFEKLELVLKNLDTEISYPLIYESKGNKTSFKTTKQINEGFNLEDFKGLEAVFLLKDGENYYTFKNNTSYSDLEYYTITKERKNYHIDVSFLKYADNEYFHLTSKEEKLPTDIYDIVIDPGHGGVDVGAKNKDIYESNLNLSYALLLKEKLEKLGLKVKLTREKDVSLANYGKKGRVSIPYQTKAKMMLSIHMNSSFYDVGSGGVEIYIPNYANPTFAKKLARNIVDNTSTRYSKNQSNFLFDGVYLRTLQESDLEQMQKDALEEGYTPYKGASLDSTYYFIIRETGGIVTGAYVDSSNKKKEGNPYYKSNHGCESYLVELGYISSDQNLSILQTEKDQYVDSIVKTIKEEFQVN